MDDRTLQNMLRMAIEAERLENDAGLRLVESRPARRPLTLVMALGAGLAAAAAIAMTAMVWPSGGTVVPAPGPLASGNRSGFERPLNEVVREARAARTASIAEMVSAPAQPASDSQADLLLAYFRGADGTCQCVEIHEHAPDGRTIAELAPMELVAAALQSPCAQLPERVVRVSVKGGDLCRDQATMLASRLRPGDEGDVSTVARDVTSLPSGVTVVAHNVATFR